MHIKGYSIISTIKNILLFHINHQIITIVIYITLYALVAPSIIGAVKASSLFSSFIENFPINHPFLFILILSPTIAKLLFTWMKTPFNGSKQSREWDRDRAEQKEIDSILKKIKNSPYR